ncbi:MAG: hypothetical protein ACYC2I_10315 [Elusimicrobiales bacterium]
MLTSVVKAAVFLAGFIALLWLGVRYGETHTAPLLAAVIAYVAFWQFIFARAVAEGLTHHYQTTLLANILPSAKLTVTPAFVRAMALLFFAAAAAVWFVF